MSRRLRLLPSLPFRLGSPRAATQQTRDATEVLPNTYRVILDNADVRVVEFRARPGQHMPMHSHPAHVIVNLSPAQVKVTYPDGKTEVLTFRSGEVVWSAGVRHAGEVLTGTVHMILVENKRVVRP